MSLPSKASGSPSLSKRLSTTMQFSRVLSVLSFFFAFAFMFASASPVLDTESAVAKRQEADVMAILTKLHAQTLADAAAISASHPLISCTSRH